MNHSGHSGVGEGYANASISRRTLDGNERVEIRIGDQALSILWVVMELQ